MQQDVFGNLEEWDRVLSRLEALGRTGDLEAHQDAIVTLLRYRDNWRLREAGLEAVHTIRKPTEALVRQVCAIMMDDQLYYQLRALAAEALGACLDRVGADAAESAIEVRREVREQMHRLLDATDVPVVHQAVRRILPKIE